jgi:hypothetical protein
MGAWRPHESDSALRRPTAVDALLESITPRDALLS